MAASPARSPGEQDSAAGGAVIADISLTSGMRSTLISLQGSVKLLDRTQNRLATGKKVNSALDNPVSFFTSVSLTDRASRLHGLKDTTSEAIQTLKTADRGIAALSTMIEQAKSIAEKALSASSTGAATTTGAITLSGVKADATGEGPVTMTVTLSGVNLFDVLSLEVGGPLSYITLRAESDYGGVFGEFFKIGANDNETAENLAHCINDLVQWDSGGMRYYRAQYLGGSGVRISKYDLNTHEQLSVEAGDYFDFGGHFNPALDPLPVLPPDEVTIGGVTFTATTGATAGTSFNVGGTDTENLQELADAINAYGGWAGGCRLRRHRHRRQAHPLQDGRRRGNGGRRGGLLHEHNGRRLRLHVPCRVEQ